MSKGNKGNGDAYITGLATFIRTNEKRLARAYGPNTHASSAATSSALQNLSAAFTSWTGLSGSISSQIRPVTLSLTPHHLFYLLARFEELGLIPQGLNTIRLEVIHSEYNPRNYVSFLNSQEQARRRGLSDSDSASIRSVASVKSVMSGMSSIWKSLGIGGNKSEKDEKAAIEAQLKYIYSAFTKIPSLRLAPDRRAKLISGYEEYPFDQAVALYPFKNVTTLEIQDIDVRSFYGWHVVAESLKSLIIRRGNINDPSELIIDLVLDDAEKRRHRSSRHIHSPSYIGEPRFPSNNSPKIPPTSPPPLQQHPARTVSEADIHENRGNRSSSPRPSSSRSNSSSRGRGGMLYRSNSVISNSSLSSSTSHIHTLPDEKWQCLKYLCLSDCSLHTLSAPAWTSLAPNLVSLDLSANLFLEIPSVLSSLYCLRSLSLAGNMIEKLQGLNLNSLPAITTLILRDNRITSLAGIERGARNLVTLDIRNNLLLDPAEISRLTAAPNMQQIWVSGNPFTRTHAQSFRLSIFNYFRATPGFTEDIQLDGSGPGMVERRHLMDRVFEKPPHPPQAQRLLSPAPLLHSRGLERETSPSPVRGQESQTMGRNARKKKPNRQRIVSLDGTVKTMDTGDKVETSGEVRPEAGGEEYRRRLEALREEAGSGWLRVLSESGGLTENGGIQENVGRM